MTCIVGSLYSCQAVRGYMAVVDITAGSRTGAFAPSGCETPGEAWPAQSSSVLSSIYSPPFKQGNVAKRGIPLPIGTLAS